MTQKPKIQYIGQFYVHGSEARALEQETRTPRTSLPKAGLERIEKVYVDPVALIGIAVAVVMLVTMVIGALQLRDDWKAYEVMERRVSWLKSENARLSHEYRGSYDLDDIKMKAQAMGMIPKSEAEVISVAITLPEPEPVLSFEDELILFWNGLWA